MSLPTYDEAVSGRSVWSLVGEHIDNSTLVTLCSVNRELNALLSSLLWRHPMIVIASKSYPFCKLRIHTNSIWAVLCSADAEEARAVAFVKCAIIARREVRRFVYFLDFRPLMQRRSIAHSDFIRHEHTISTAWVLRHVGLFESLRLVVVDGLDVVGGKDTHPKELINPNEAASLRILVFSGSYMCRDTSSILKAEYFENLMFLNLSYTARGESWTRAISGLPLDNLRVLKLRGLRLTDRNLPRCVLKSRCRLWSLDLRDNFLTDQTIDALLESSFLPPIPHAGTFDATPDGTLYEDTPPYVHLPSHQPPDDTCASRLDDLDNFAEYLTSYTDLAGLAPLTAEDAHHNPLTLPTGLTHLYLSSNKFTSSGIHYLLHTTNRLQVLDVGSVRHVASPPTFHIPFTAAYAQPDTAKLLSRSSDGTRLESLRIHHSIVTHVPTILPGSHESNGGNNAFQLPWLKQAETVFGPKQVDSWESFNPLDNYHLSRLTLTDIPTLSFGMVIDSLLSLLNSCVDQQRALEHARRGSVVNRRSPRLLPGLRKLRLEFVAVAKPADKMSPFESVSEDIDADEFTRQGRGDFSFFGEGNEDGGDGESESWSYTGTGRHASRGSIGAAKVEEEEEVTVLRDVIEEIKAWRSTDAGRGWSGKLELARPVG